MQHYFVPVRNSRHGEPRLVRVCAPSAEAAQRDATYKASRELGYRRAIADTPSGPRAKSRPRTP